MSDTGLRLVDFCDYCGWQKSIIRVEKKGRRTLNWCGCKAGEVSEVTAAAIPKKEAGQEVGSPVDKEVVLVKLRTKLGWIALGLVAGFGAGFGVAIVLFIRA